jgi:hypothetical protein
VKKHNTPTAPNLAKTSLTGPCATVGRVVSDRKWRSPARVLSFDRSEQSGRRMGRRVTRGKLLPVLLGHRHRSGQRLAVQRLTQGNAEPHLLVEVKGRLIRTVHAKTRFGHAAIPQEVQTAGQEGTG